ncbi:MAG: low molecular weight protein-tyrosine-phosphatase [Dialister pneumosintes]
MIRVLFVCHGNICRSPMAEFIMKDIVKKAGLDEKIEISSVAATQDEIGNDMYPPAKRKLEEMGIPYTRRAARLFTSADYEKYDVIIGMDEENREDLLHLTQGDPKKKLKQLMDFTDTPKEVADPWYTGNFNETYEDILRGTTGLLQALRKQM